MSKSNYVWFDNDTMITESDLPKFLGTTAEKVRFLIRNRVFERIGHGSTLHWQQGYPDVFDRHRVRSDFNRLRNGGMIVFLDSADNDRRS